MSIENRLTKPAFSADIERRLRELHDYYAFQVNVAVEAGREGDIDGLVASRPDEGARLIECTGPARPERGAL